MKDRLLIPTLAGAAFLAALGLATVRGQLWQAPAPAVKASSAAAIPAPPERTPVLEAAAATPAQATAPEMAASEPEPDSPQTSDVAAVATYEEQSAAHDRAAAHSARSR